MPRLAAKEQPIARISASPLDQRITHHIWKDKYRYGDEKSPSDTFRRVVEGVYEKDPSTTAKDLALKALLARDLLPGGRILAGAGTGKRVTWINCFLSPDIQDSMETEPDQPGLGIMDALKVAAFTQQKSGGIGMDFSTLRPCGAIVVRTGSVSAGILCFMDMWHGMCGTIKSSGSRRGAMMGTLACWHPDVIDFITAKQKKGRLKNFNVSVTCTNDFMKAIERDLDWDLGFHVPRADNEHVTTYERDGKPWYVYKRMKARELWDLILKNTYHWAEPGVIFIDRINELNNLQYCERISCTNPCGEQPLPQNGNCNLSHVNLATMVNHPFEDRAEVDWNRLKETTRILVRFLDNVLDTSPFPTEEQKQEALAKRRIGGGYTGLGNLLQQLKIRYGNDRSVAVTGAIGEVMANTAYLESIELAKERGPFPAFDKEEFLKAPFLKKLDPAVREGIEKYGIRNGVLLSLAPTGTGSIFYGNVSAGPEPSFAFNYSRDVVVDQRGDEQIKEVFEVEDYGYALFKDLMWHGEKLPSDTLPDYMVTALELSVDEHLKVAAAAQYWIDAAISKTINCPESMPYEEFKHVYQTAWELGMKGCTTYRPSEVRESVLRTEEQVKTPNLNLISVPTRPERLEGETHKLKWMPDDSTLYLTINDLVDEDGSRRPFEIFLNSKAPGNFEHMTALSLAISAVCRRGDAGFLFEELTKVHSPNGGAFVGHQYVPSLIALVGEKLLEHTKQGTDKEETHLHGEKCSACGKHAVIRQEGCYSCQACGAGKCG